MKNQETNSSKVRTRALLVAVLCLILVTGTSISIIYVVNTPIPAPARVDPQISFIQDLNSTESIVSNYVGISLSPQPPIPL